MESIWPISHVPPSVKHVHMKFFYHAKLAVYSTAKRTQYLASATSILKSQSTLCAENVNELQ